MTLAWIVLSLGGLACLVDEIHRRAGFRRAAESCRRQALRRRLHWRCD